MTREEAIKRFQRIKKILSIPNSDAARTIEAIDMAIKALRETPTNQEKHQLSKETSTNTPTDLISRADAIEAVAQQWLFEASAESPYVNDDDIGDYRKLASELLSDIPSADRPIVDKEYLIDLIQEAVYDGEACSKLMDLVDRPSVEWIPVSERLPETHGLYMVTFDNGSVYVARYDGGWYTIDSYGLLSMTSYVIAWMPLPTPYKGGDEE